LRALRKGNKKALVDREKKKCNKGIMSQGHRRNKIPNQVVRTKSVVFTGGKEQDQYRQMRGCTVSNQKTLQTKKLVKSRDEDWKGGKREWEQ